MRRNEVRDLSILVIAFGAVLASLLLRGVIDIAQAMELIVLFSLVLVTIIYAKRTSDIARATKEQAEATKQQADASVEMAEEMREQRLAMYKPHIMMKIESSSRGNYFATRMGVSLKNEGRSPAINVNLLVSHPVFRFNKIDYPYQIAVGEKISARELTLENDVNMPGFEKPATLIANYEDVSGNLWHSTLELLYDGSSKDIKLGRMQVPLPGHFKSGEHD